MTLLAEANIEAVLQTEEEYLYNHPIMSNKEFLIFFGLGDETKSQAATIKNWDFDVYGAKIGKAGNVCVITVYDIPMSFKDLADFSSYCTEKSEDHADIVIPGIDLEYAMKGMHEGDKALWRAQYSVLIYEFMDNRIDKYLYSSEV